jgi:hypothetical protein
LLVLAASAEAMTGDWGLPRKTGKNPTDVGDVVGRDLNLAGAGFAGHVAIWDGANVIEALNEAPSSLKINSLDSFKRSSPYWGAVWYPPNEDQRVTVQICTEGVWGGRPCRTVRSKFAFVEHARNAVAIGATYTFAASYTPFGYGCAYGYSVPCNSTIMPSRGIYRCDTFVKDIFNRSYPQRNTYGYNISYSSTPHDIYMTLAER